MSYTVFIPAAGLGSRLDKLTKCLNKALVSINNKPTISHIIDQFPHDCKFVVALGYKGNLLREYLTLAYPHRDIKFSEVTPYQGPGSGLGKTLLDSKHYLDAPFVFTSCDTLVKGTIPALDRNWIGYSNSDVLSPYRTIAIENNRVVEILEKGEGLDSSNFPYIGLCGIYNHELFWEIMSDRSSSVISAGESYGLRGLIPKGISSIQFDWFDTGNHQSLHNTRTIFRTDDSPNILDKENEAIWFVDNRVIKFSTDPSFIKNRVERSQLLHPYVPKILKYTDNMYCYEKVEGKAYSDVANLGSFRELLVKCQKFWLSPELSSVDRDKFDKQCFSFYHDKTYDRLKLYYSRFDRTDSIRTLNGMPVKSCSELLASIDWNWLCSGKPGRFHGDFHFENIIFSDDEYFIFIDWRQDFGGDLSFGDIYYDLAKLMHGLLVSHNMVVNNMFSVQWSSDRAVFDIHRKLSTVECESYFVSWLIENSFDVKKVYVLTALIFLNIAALHHYPYSNFLYCIGVSLLSNHSSSKPKHG